MTAPILITVLLMAGGPSGPDALAQDAAPTPAPAATPSPADTLAPPPAVDCLARPLDASERDLLLRLAWRTLTGHLTDKPIKDADLEAYAFTPCLLAPRGLFVTLRKAGRVRGMQGEIEPARPLYQQVIVFTRRAATRDARFPPLSDADLGETVIELALIGERRRVSGPSEIRPDSQGVFLEKWGRRALLLPGLPAQQGWTAERTLDELCSQASLPKGSWAKSARIDVFATEIVAGAPPAEPPAQPPPPSPAPEPAVKTPSPVRSAR